MAANDWLCQFLADLLQSPVERPVQVETTALGVAFLAGLATGIWPDLHSVARCWARERRFEPRMNAGDRQKAIDGWRAAVARTMSDFRSRD
jgi:glycerol kinase